MLGDFNCASFQKQDINTCPIQLGICYGSAYKSLLRDLWAQEIIIMCIYSLYTSLFKRESSDKSEQKLKSW